MHHLLTAELVCFDYSLFHFVDFPVQSVLRKCSAYARLVLSATSQVIYKTRKGDLKNKLREPQGRASGTKRALYAKVMLLWYSCRSEPWSSKPRRLFYGPRFGAENASCIQQFEEYSRVWTFIEQLIAASSLRKNSPHFKNEFKMADQRILRQQSIAFCHVSIAWVRIHCASNEQPRFRNGRLVHGQNQNDDCFARAPSIRIVSFLRINCN